MYLLLVSGCHVQFFLHTLNMYHTFSNTFSYFAGHTMYILLGYIYRNGRFEIENLEYVIRNSRTEIINSNYIFVKFAIGIKSKIYFNPTMCNLVVKIQIFV